MMKKTIQLILLLASLSLTSCEPVLPASVTVGGSWNHTANSNLGDAAGVLGRLETPLYKKLNVSLEYAYHGDIRHNDYGYFRGNSLLGTLVYRPGMRCKIQPYLLGGAGWSWWHFKNLPYITNNQITVKLGNAFAYRIGAGLEYPFTKNWSVSLEWSFFKADVPKSSTSSDGSFANVLGSERTVGTEETNLVIGVGYRW